MAHESLGETIRRLRREKNMTQSVLAEQVSVVTSTISNWENSWRRPSLTELKRLAEVFEIPLARLIDDENSIENPDNSHVIPADEALIKNMQLVDLKPLNNAWPMLAQIGISTGMILLLLGYLLPGILGTIALLLGLFSCGLTAVYQSVVHFIGHHNQSKRILLPPSHQIFHVHPASLATLKHQRLKTSIPALSGIFTVPLLVGLVLLLFRAHPEPAVFLIISVFGMATSISAFFRYKAIHGLFKKQLPYLETAEDLRYPSIAVGALLESLVFTCLIVSLEWLQQPLSVYPVTRWVTVLIALVNATMALYLYKAYKSYVSACVIEVMDDTGAQYTPS